MSITSQDSKAGPYECNGIQTEFPFGFRVLDAAHVTVYIDDAIVESGFSVLLSAIGGTVVLSTAPPAGAALAIVRNVPLTQEVDLQNNTAFLPEVIENAMDKLTMICQQLKEVLSRTWTAPPTLTDADSETLFDRFGQLARRAETAATEAEASQLAATAAAAMAVEIADLARQVIAYYRDLELNKVTLELGPWSPTDSGVLIDYGVWTPTRNPSA